MCAEGVCGGLGWVGGICGGWDEGSGAGEQEEVAASSGLRGDSEAVGRGGGGERGRYRGGGVV